ncbi:MAG: DNA-binding protein [Candidatus Hecatellales archaeon]|nr:MAG: DNA-binding protein [Candidatus Hecatellales archaeon]
MGFEKFGKISYIRETKVAPFVDYLEQGKVMATRCRSCGKMYFPPRMDCEQCMTSDNMEWKEIVNEWKILTYTVSEFAPTGFEDDVPYILAIAESAEGLRVFTRLSKDVKEEQLQSDMKFKLAPVRLPDGKITYELQPLEEG